MSALHREYPEATEDEIRAKHAAALVGIGGDATAARSAVERVCRDCGSPFLLTPEAASRRRTKWTTCCAFCLVDEF